MDHAEIRAVFEELAAAFSALDLPRFRQCYTLPCQFITAAGVKQARDEQEFAEFFGPMMARLREANFGHSAFDFFNVRLLDENLALATLHWTRFRQDDSVLERLGATYTLRRDGAWRVVGLIGHPIDAA